MKLSYIESSREMLFIWLLDEFQCVGIIKKK